MSAERSWEKVTVSRQHILRFLDEDQVKAVRGAANQQPPEALPRYTSQTRWGRDKPVTYAVTGAYVDHTWNGTGWTEKRSLVGMQLNRDGTPAQRGYDAERGIPLWNLADPVPDVVTAFWEAHPTPTTRLAIVEA